MSVTTDNELPPTDDDSLEDLQSRSRLGGAELDAEDFNEDGTEADLPDLDVPLGDLEVKVIPRQADEFMCSSCFLVVHRSQLASTGPDVCRDCD